jgi:hypothetical protein
MAEIKTVKGHIDYFREWMLERYEVLCEYYGAYKEEEPNENIS